MEETFELLFSLSSDLVCILKHSGDFYRVNAAFGELLNMPQEKISGLSFFGLMTNEDRDQAIQKIQHDLITNDEVELAAVIHPNSAEPVSIQWKFKAIRSTNQVIGLGKIISVEARLDKLIEQQKQRFSEMFDNAPVMMCILKGPDFVFESANALYYKFTGRENIIGKTVREVFPEAEGQGIFELMEFVYSTGETYNINEKKLELKVFGKLEELYLSFMFQPFRNPEGAVEGIFYFGVNITEQVLARKKIIESRSQYIELIQNLPVAVFTCDVKGRIQLYNKAAVALWARDPGSSNKQWCGCMEIYDMQDQRISFDDSALSAAVKTGKPVKGEEIRIKRPNGEFRYVVPYPSPVFDAEGNVTGGVNVLIDITERKKIEQQRELLSLIGRKTINAVIITDSNGKVEWVNEAFEKMTGYKHDEVLGKQRTSILFDPITDSLVIKNLEEKFRTALDFEMELVQYNSRGEAFWIEMQVRPILDANGRPSHFFEMHTDITQRKRAYNELASRNHAIGRFAKELNHILENERSRIAREIHDEFGQQLTGLKMSLSSLMNFENIDDTARDIIKELVGYTDHSIQALRRISTELRPDLLDSLGLIPAVEWLVKEFEKRTGITCSIAITVQNQHFDKDLSITFYRICQEALTNISKHAEANHVQVKFTEDNDYLCLEISDDGKGIEIAQLSDPYAKGLLGMRERAGLIGAELKISKGKIKGTTVQIISRSNA